MRLIRRAAVKSQCSGDYFYGKDQKLERAIQETERAYGMILSDLRERANRVTDAHKNLMRLFWFFQYMRTEYAARKSIEMLDSVGKKFNLSPEDFNMGVKEAVQEAMNIFVSEMHVVEDMSVAFGINNTTLPIITSDNPAVLCNRWISEDDRCRGMSIGLISAGNIMVMPLTPSIVFVGYDSGVYSIPKNHGWFSITKEADTRSFNQLQVLNCNANLYVPPGANEVSIFKLADEVKPRRPARSHETEFFVRDAEYVDRTWWRRATASDIEGNHEVLVQVKPVHPDPADWPSCINWRRQGKAYADGSAVGYVRAAVARSKRDRKFNTVDIRRGRIRAK